MNDSDILMKLALWRNDPEHAEVIKQKANEGHTDYQYVLGLLYAEGRGIEYNPKLAYYWLSHAIRNGDTEASDLRQIVQESMSLDEIHAAEQLIEDSINVEESIHA